MNYLYYHFPKRIICRPTFGTFVVPYEYLRWPGLGLYSFGVMISWFLTTCFFRINQFQNTLTSLNCVDTIYLSEGDVQFSPFHLGGGTGAIIRKRHFTRWIFNSNSILNFITHTSSIDFICKCLLIFFNVAAKF